MNSWQRALVLFSAPHRSMEDLAARPLFWLPLVLTLVATVLPSLTAAAALVLAAVSGLGGVLLERWLFFAEAKHAVTLYYGTAAV